MGGELFGRVRHRNGAVLQDVGVAQGAVNSRQRVVGCHGKNKIHAA
jgi:hypothetical protein